jgi:hypothetical protein
MNGYKWRLVYKPPIKNINYNDLDSLPKIFYISIYECPEKLDLHLKINELKRLYNMKDEYVSIENIID